MAQIDDPPVRFAGLTEIRVDTSGVERFAGTVETEVDANFRPQAGRLAAVYEPGAFFGINHASPDVQAARQRHAACLQGATEQLVGYVNASKILVDAARTVAARYRQVDALAAANSKEIELALADAVGRANAVEHPAGMTRDHPRNVE
jgi:hypothetical protein